MSKDLYVSEVVSDHDYEVGWRWRHMCKQVGEDAEKCHVQNEIQECMQEVKERCTRWWLDQLC